MRKNVNPMTRRTGLIVAMAGLMNGLLLPVLIITADADRASLPTQTAPGSALIDANKHARQRVAEAYGKLPLCFKPSTEQADQGVKFISRAGDRSVFLGSTEAVLRLRIADVEPRNAESQSAVGGFSEPQSAIIKRSAALRMRLEGANASARAVGLDELESKSN